MNKQKVTHSLALEWPAFSVSADRLGPVKRVKELWTAPREPPGGRYMGRCGGQAMWPGGAYLGAARAGSRGREPAWPMLNLSDRISQAKQVMSIYSHYDCGLFCPLTNKHWKWTMIHGLHFDLHFYCSSTNFILFWPHGPSPVAVPTRSARRPRRKRAPAPTAPASRWAAPRRGAPRAARRGRGRGCGWRGAWARLGVSWSQSRRM